MVALSEGRDSEVTGKVRARVRLADGSLYNERGRIDFLDVQVNPRTDGQTVRAIFPNPDDILTRGQTVRVIVEEKGGDQVVALVRVNRRPRGTTAELNLAIAHLWTIRDGKAARCQAFAERDRALEAAGLPA